MAMSNDDDDDDVCVWGHWRWSLLGSLSSSVIPLRSTQCQWEETAIYVVMRATRDAQSPKLKDEKQISIGLSHEQQGLKPGRWCENLTRYKYAIVY